MCEPSERALRAWTNQKVEAPTSPDQREWCLQHIAAVEGYDRADFEGTSDQNVASGVLDAWRDYCQDKGLL